MKKLFYLFIATSLFISCAGEDTPEISITESGIEGKWNVTAMTSKVETSSTNKGVTVTSKTETTGKDFNFVYYFKRNPNSVSGTGTYNAVVTTSTNGKTHTLQTTSSSISNLKPGTWTLDNNSIIVETNGTKQTATIESYDNKTMVLKTVINQSKNIQGISTSIVGNATFTLER